MIFDYLKILFISFLPSLFWLIVCCYFDWKRPEPIRQIIKVFGWGILITVPVFLIAHPLTAWINGIHLPVYLTIFILSFLVDGLIEETAKYLILRIHVFKLQSFDEPRDGIIYGMTAALGLAFAENFLYVLLIGPEIIFFRFATTTLMHFLAGGIIGYHFGLVRFYRMKEEKRHFLIWRGLILAIIFHGLYNSFVRFQVFWSFIPMVLLLIGAYLYILFDLKKFSS